MNRLKNVCCFSLLGIISTGVAYAQAPEVSEEGATKELTSPTVTGDEQTADAEGSVAEFIDKLSWQKEGSGALGERATIVIPEGYRLGDNRTTSRLMAAMGNVPSGEELGILGPHDLHWFVIYEFDDVGYVKDDEELDPDAMLTQQRSAVSESNKYREEKGLATVNLLGWAIPPRYEPNTNVLEWAVKAEFTHADATKAVAVNYRTKVLGRRGVMDITVVCSPEDLDRVLPEYRELMNGFSFVEGERYAEYKPGDKIAEYGLAALVLGGATAVAAKTGMFAAILLFFKKGLKLIMVGVVALGAAISRLFTGKKPQQPDV
ncbi:MAG: DUF2167 domain-containing protein [Myxococcales bacterium]|nr:DUF2167 domain-containing protein [Myxococcales bacterium]